MPLSHMIQRSHLSHLKLFVVWCLGLFLSAHAFSQDIRLVGTVGDSRAILVLGNQQPKTLRTGQTHNGVKLVSVQSNTATFEIAGQSHTLTVGQTPTHVAAAGAGQALTLKSVHGGHYAGAGEINGHAVDFLVDTGATTISLDASTAQRLGINYTQGQRIPIMTANGQTHGWTVQLDEVRFGTLTQRNVLATVSEQSMPFVLLGNSFLNHYRMTRDAQAMTLHPR